MLAGKEMVATIAVKDLATARKFYEGTLGLKVEDDKGTEAHTYRSAGTRLIVYRSQFAGTNQATAAASPSASTTTPSASMKTNPARP